MGFGKPKQSAEQVRCLMCASQYRDCDTILHHAGRTVDGDYWNSECPECGQYDMMKEEYAQMTEEEFEEKRREFEELHGIELDGD